MEADKTVLKYFSETGTHVGAECLHCGRVWNLQKANLSEIDGGFMLSGPFTCKCGGQFREIGMGDRTRNSQAVIEIRKDESAQGGVKCPKCGSTQVAANKKGFGLGKALGGGFLLGPVGLLGGLVGSRKILISCLKCGNQWSP